MKTKLQNLFMAALTLAASTQKLGVNLIRVAILVIFVWIGGLKAEFNLQMQQNSD